MQFTKILALAGFFASTTMAQTNSTNGTAYFDDIQTTCNLIAYASDAQSTDGLSCSWTCGIWVIEKGVCIATAIETKNITALLACVEGQTAMLCNCATCIPGLEGLLHEHGICP